MILKSETQIWVQALYGQNWEDFEEALDNAHATYVLSTLKTTRPTGKFRIIHRTITEYSTPE